MAFERPEGSGLDGGAGLRGVHDFGERRRRAVMAGNGFLNQLIDELSKRERADGALVDSVVSNAAPAETGFSNPLDALAAPVRDLAGGIQDLSGQVKGLQDATQASVENVNINTRALERSVEAIRSIGLGAAEKAGAGLAGAISLFPLFKGLKSLFGGDEDAMAAAVTVATSSAASRSLDSSLRGEVLAGYSERGAVRPAPVQEIHVHVQTLDSQSFADNSGKIAAAVRTAMLESGSLSDVWGEF